MTMNFVLKGNPQQLKGLSDGAVMLEVNDFLKPKSILLTSRDSRGANKDATGEDELILHSQFPPLNLGDKVVLPAAGCDRALKENTESKAEQGMDEY